MKTLESRLINNGYIGYIKDISRYKNYSNLYIRLLVRKYIIVFKKQLSNLNLNKIGLLLKSHNQENMILVIELLKSIKVKDE